MNDWSTHWRHAVPLNIDYWGIHKDTLNNAGLLQPKFGSNVDKPKCWVRFLKKFTVRLGWNFTF